MKRTKADLARAMWEHLVKQVQFSYDDVRRTAEAHMKEYPSLAALIDLCDRADGAHSEVCGELERLMRE